MKRSDRPARNGQTLAEFAIVLPVLLLLIFGIIEFGRAVFIYNTLSDAARQGARVAAVNQRASGSGVKCDPLDRASWTIVACVQQVAVSIPLTYSPNSPNSNITIKYVGPNWVSDKPCVPRVLDPITPCIAIVTVSYPYQPFTPIISDIIGTINMSSTSQMPVEAYYP